MSAIKNFLMEVQDLDCNGVSKEAIAAEFSLSVAQIQQILRNITELSE